MSNRAALLERYRSLPLPTTSMEAWRFTDLAGFDPDAYTVPNGHAMGQSPTKAGAAMLDIDAAASAV